MSFSLSTSQVLSPVSVSSSVPFSLVTKINYVNGSLWHDILGHPHQTILDQVVKRLNMRIQSHMSYNVCNACQKAKSHRLPS